MSEAGAGGLIRFVEWTAEGRLRHAAFLGFRSDKASGDVRTEDGRPALGYFSRFDFRFTSWPCARL